MAGESSMALDDLLRKTQLSDDVDFLREGVRALAQALMAVEVPQHVGARRYERSAERKGERNGIRERRWDTRMGSLTLRVPRVRDGSYFPRLLEPRRRAERARGARLTAVALLPAEQGGQRHRVGAPAPACAGAPTASRWPKRTCACAGRAISSACARAVCLS